MSAWIVSKAHIDALVHAVAVREMIEVSPDAVGRTLWGENHRSVNARYGEDTETPRYRYAPPPVAWTASQLIKHVRCYDYQSCEHDAWETSDAARLLAELEAALEAEGGRRDDPINDKDTPWGIPDCGQAHPDWIDCDHPEPGMAPAFTEQHDPNHP